MSFGLSDPRGSEMWTRIERLFVPMVPLEFPWLEDPYFVDPIGFLPWGRNFQGINESSIEYIFPSVLVVPSRGVEYHHGSQDVPSSWEPTLFRPYWTGLGILVTHDATWDLSQWRLATFMEGLCAIAQQRVLVEGNLSFVVGEVSTNDEGGVEIGLHGDNRDKPYLLSPAHAKLPRLLFRIIPGQVIPN
jgi:hypothetical protein